MLDKKTNAKLFGILSYYEYERDEKGGEQSMPYLIDLRYKNVMVCRVKKKFHRELVVIESLNGL